MPTFDCGGEGCGGIYCPCCTPEAVTLRYTKEVSKIFAARKARGETSCGTETCEEMRRAEERVRKLWREKQKRLHTRFLDEDLDEEDE